MSTVSQSPPTFSEAIAAPPKARDRVRIDFLDGLRGLAALYVMLAHEFTLGTFDANGISSSLSPAFLRATWGLRYPHYSVALFIVLSGFCLMLPVARAHDRRLPGGLLRFVKRRAQRILPPYYIALAFVLAILFTSHHLVKHTGEGAADLSSGNILAHVFLLHNLSAKYNMSLDTPMWSVAWEWQIYFLFALVLLPVWRRFGIMWTIALGFGVGLLPGLLLPEPSNLSWTSPWYLGLFALGMGAAVVLCSETERYRLMKRADLQNAALCVLAGGLIIVALARPQWLAPDFYWIVDTHIGALTALLILACANKSNRGWLHKKVVEGLESRSMMRLGAFSYSLYLVHYPLLRKIRDILVQSHFSHSAQYVILLVVGTPVCLVAAYLFHLAFERPFMPGRPKRSVRPKPPPSSAPRPDAIREWRAVVWNVARFVRLYASRILD